MARRSVRFLFQCALAATLFPGGVSARAAPVDEDWVTWRGADGAPACIDGAAFESDVSRRLGADARAVARRVGLRLEVDLGDGAAGPAPASTPEPLEATPAAMSLVVATFAGTDGHPIGRRRFDLRGSSCQSAFEALSIATTLVLRDRAHALEPARARPPAIPVGEASPEVLAGRRAMVTGGQPIPPETDHRQVVAKASARATLPATSRRGPPFLSSVGGRAGALVGIGDVPAGTWGIEATLQAGGAAGPTFFIAGDVWPRQRTSSDVAGVDISLQVLAGRAGLCPLDRQWATRGLSLCAAFALGRIAVEGSGLGVSDRQDRWRLAVDGGVALTQQVYGGWSAALETRLVLPFQRDRVTAADSSGGSQDLFRAAPVGGAAVVSFGYAPKSSAR